jgi:D-alanyl-lipoteichoic acid acyltransferase DltB (MBOAT superfamily)
MVIFLVSGFWHGANWTFIVWGAYHALLFLPLLLFGKNRKYTDTVAAGRLLPSFKEIIQMLLTFFLVVVGWVIFRAENIGQAWDYLCRIFSSSLFTLPNQNRKLTLVALIYSIILLTVEWSQRNKQHALQIDSVKYRAIRWGICLLAVLYIITNAGSQAEFIYFQF